MASSVLDSKPLLLSMHNVYPFMPEAGIFCGGFQGIVYPNPTLLLDSTGLFDPTNFQQAVPTDYTVKNSSDIYGGIGQGNPGINYRNPGHLLGIFDTFLRMSFGLQVIRDSRDQVEHVSLPMESLSIDFTDLDRATQNFTLNNIYPDFSELPSDYIDNFIDSGELLLDPRLGDIYRPDVGAVNFNFFNNILTESYRSVIPKMLEFFNDLRSTASVMSTENSESLSPVGLGQITDPGPGQKEPAENIPQPVPLSHPQTNWPPIRDGTFTGMLIPGDAFFVPATDYLDGFGHQHKATILQPTEALNIFSGDSSFHEVDDNLQHEYRSITEMNSILNLIPINIHGFRWVYRVNWDTGSPAGDVFMNGLTNPTWMSVIICDINFITRVPGPITITGTADFQGGQPPLVFELRNGRNMLATTTITNHYNWDRGWFDRPSVLTQDEDFNETIHVLDTPIFSPGPYPAPTSPGAIAAFGGNGQAYDPNETMTFQKNITIPDDGTAYNVRVNLIFSSRASFITAFNVQDKITFNIEIIGSDFSLSNNMVISEPRGESNGYYL